MSDKFLKSIESDPRYSTPGKSLGLLDVFRQRYLLKLLVRKGIATRYYGSVLGWIWSYIRPGAQFLMFYLVIGLILGGSRGTSWFPIYLFAGIVAINLFSETLRNTTTSITDNAPLVGKIYLPRELFPVSACGVALVHFLPQAVLLFILTMLCGLQLTVINILFFLAGTLIIIVFALGLGLFFGAINALYRDAVNFVDLILMFATWIAPVLYPWHLMHDIASPWVYRIFMSDPLAGAVELFHNAFWLPLAPESPRPENLTTYVLIGAGISLVTLFAGQIVFRKMEASFAQRL